MLWGRLCENYLAKWKEVFWAFIDLEGLLCYLPTSYVADAIRVYEVRRKLLKAVLNFYLDSRACFGVGINASESVLVSVGLRQGCVTFPWVFNVYMDGVMREVNARVLRKLQ